MAHPCWSCRVFVTICVRSARHIRQFSKKEITGSLPPSRDLGFHRSQLVMATTAISLPLVLFFFLAHTRRATAIRATNTNQQRTNGLRAETVSTTIVISQVYGGGGNSGAPYQNDYVELFNLGSTTVSITGWSVQYASATGAGTFAANPIATLSGSISPGQYYLVKQGSGGSTGAALPAPDATGTVNMSASSGKVALVNTSTGLTCNGGSTPCSTSDSAKIVDLIGYGTANFYEGAAAAPGLSNTTADFRDNNGCTDTDNNNTDFTASYSNPRNSASAMSVCSGGGSLTITNGSPLPNGTVGVSYSTTFAASGGSGSGYSFSLLSGTLPPGLTLNGALLTGTPSTTAGSPFSFTVQVIDSASNTSNKAFQLTVLPPNACAVATPSPQSCGVERWSVKTGTDADVGLVNLDSATPTTIAKLRARAYPSPSPPANNRVAPAETTQWIIQGTLVQYKLESDSDYHLVVQDGSGNSMVTEIPYPGATPSCVSRSSPFYSGITNARCKFDSTFTATTSFQTANVPVRVIGIGMFDFPHGQTGAAPNQIELHPIVDIAFPAIANATTATGSNVNVKAGNASVTFTSVTGGGTTTATPIDPSAAGTPTSGYTATGPAFDIATNAMVSGPIGVCINVPYITDASSFSGLRLLHLEGGSFVDRTTSTNFSSKTVCGSAPSLSPFVVAVTQGPTAAAAFVTGKVTDANGEPVGGVMLTLSGARLARAVTDANGLYSFGNLDAAGFYSIAPELANYSFSPSARSFSLLGNKTEALFTATQTRAIANPLDSAEFFVRQQYLDLLDREPDQDGLDYWSAQIRSCGVDARCVRSRRISVSAAFFVEQEFQQTGFFIYRLHEASFGKPPSYSQYVAGRLLLRSGPNLDANRAAFADSFVKRNEFQERYSDRLSNYEFVNRLLDSAGLVFAPFERQRYIDALDGGANRGWVLSQVVEDEVFKQAHYNPAFVLSQYFGYLRRDPDDDGYRFWLNVLNSQPENYSGMVCAFITSIEYQQRFSPVVTHSNAECAPVRKAFVNNAVQAPYFSHSPTPGALTTRIHNYSRLVDAMLTVIGPCPRGVRRRSRRGWKAQLPLV
jgi:Lamin Tail Domain/Carboxypeptidase regulatory-like domain/Putative Ig domain/Domain of unknown function (DUF4214)